MPLDVFAALFIFAAVATVTPGPNNFMVLASGVNFGFRRTIPHMLGIAGGFAVLLVAVGLGLGALLTAFPSMHLALKIAGALYLLYLAWKIATSRSISSGSEERAQPMSFLEAAIFQWVNPKAWVLALTSVAVYVSPAAPVVTMALVIAAFLLVMLPCISVWTACGIALRGFLSDPVRLKWFNIVMGVALVATLWPMLK